MADAEAMPAAVPPTSVYGKAHGYSGPIEDTSKS